MKKVIISSQLIFILSIMLLPVQQSISAENALTFSLEDCVNHALMENLNLRSFNLGLRSSEISIVQAESFFDPSVSLSMNRNKSVTPNYFTYYNANSIESSTNNINMTLGQNLSYGSNWGIGMYNTLSESNIEREKNYTSNLGINIVQPLLQGFGKDINRSNVYIARIMSESAMDDLESTAIDLVYNVQSAYWNLVYARESLEVREMSLAQADSLLAYNQKGYELGILTESDVLEAKSQVVLRQQDILDQINAIKNSEDVIRRLLNLTSEDEMSLEIVTTDKPLIVPLNIDEDVVLNNALKLRPDYKIAQRTLKQNEINIAVAKNSILPSLDLNARYILNSSGTTISKDLKDLGNTDAYGWQLGLTLSYPLKNRSAKADYDMRQIEMKRALLALEDVESRIKTEIMASIRNVNINSEKIEGAQLSVELNELKLKMEEERFKNKLSTSYYVLLFQSDLANARNVYNKALVDYKISVVDFQRASGTLLENMNISIIPSE
ncbi:TolC family protein [Candidatus Latescibacterota bacterium]